MTLKSKRLYGIAAAVIVLLIGLGYGLCVMADEDRYGDLVYFDEKVEDGDIILKCSESFFSTNIARYETMGIIETSLGRVYVWDHESTLRKTLFDWAELQNAQKVKVLRPKKAVDLKSIKKINGGYSYLLQSDDFEVVAESG